MPEDDHWIRDGLKLLWLFAIGGVAVIFMSFLDCPAHAATYWVNVRAAGNDSGSDSTNALTTIAEVNSAAAPGDKFVFAGGHYNDANLNPSASGTPTQRIRFVSAGYAGSYASPDSGRGADYTIGTTDGSPPGANITATSSSGSYLTLMGLGIGEVGLFSTYPNSPMRDSVYACRIYADLGLRGAQDCVVAYCTIGDSTTTDHTYVTFVGSADQQSCIARNTSSTDNCDYERSNGEGESVVSNYQGSWRDTLRHSKVFLGQITNDQRGFYIRCDAQELVIDSNTVVAKFKADASKSDVNAGVYLTGSTGCEFKDNRWIGYTVNDPASSGGGAERHLWFWIRDYAQYNTWTRDTLEMAMNDTTDTGGLVELAVSGTCDGSITVHHNAWRKCLFKSTGAVYNQMKTAYATFDSCAFYAINPRELRGDGRGAALMLNEGYAYSITNNTVYAAGAPALYVTEALANTYGNDGVAPPFAKSTFLNNIFYRRGTYKGESDQLATVARFNHHSPSLMSCNYNLYFQSDNDSTDAVSSPTASGGETLQEWRIRSGHDAQSSWGDPLFQTVHPDSFGGRVRCGSAAKGKAYPSGDVGAHPVTGVAPATVADLAPYQLGFTAETDAVQLQWTAPGNFGASGGTVLGYQVRYRIGQAIVNASDFQAAIQVGGPPADSLAAPGATQRFTVTGLSDDTNYYWAVRPINICGVLGEGSSTSPCTFTLPLSGPIKTCVEE